MSRAVDSSATTTEPAPDAAQEPFEILKSRTAEGLGFSVKARATGKLYRVEPMRFPREPRFWCLSVQRCLTNGTHDPDERAWISETLLKREELADALHGVRADFSGWLGLESHSRLRRWLLDGADATA